MSYSASLGTRCRRGDPIYVVHGTAAYTVRVQPSAAMPAHGVELVIEAYDQWAVSSMSVVVPMTMNQYNTLRTAAPYQSDRLFIPGINGEFSFFVDQPTPGDAKSHLAARLDLKLASGHVQLRINRTLLPEFN